jgi:hypothetical protein
MSIGTLEGVWELDWKRSDSPDAVLSAQGVGYVTRKIICGLNITETLTISETEVKMEKATKVKNTCDVLKIGAKEAITDDVLGNVTQSVTVDEEKTKIVIELVGDSGTTTNTRTLSADGKEMVFVSSFTDKNGKEVRATRYFTRQ